MVRQLQYWCRPANTGTMAYPARRIWFLGAYFAAFLICYDVIKLAKGQDGADELIQRNEDAVRELASLATELYQTRQKTLPSCRERLSTHGCGNMFPESYTCTAEFPTFTEGCGDCPETGRKVSALRNARYAVPTEFVARTSADFMEPITLNGAYVTPLWSSTAVVFSLSCFRPDVSSARFPCNGQKVVAGIDLKVYIHSWRPRTP